jgi:hypothetical protein
MKIKLLLFIILTEGTAPAAVSRHIKVDHYGYRPADPKVAIVTSDPGANAEVRDTLGNIVFRIPQEGGSILFRGYDNTVSGDSIWWVDFSPFQTAGDYQLNVSGLGQSYRFALHDSIYNEPVLVALKSYYYQRCGVPKPATFAGVWNDAAACHLKDTAAAKNTLEQPQGPDWGRLNLSGGWHDAGDYNKYVWDQSTWYLLTAYELNPSRFTDNQTNIPESGNGIPDILDEVKFELDWLLRMQRPDSSVLERIHSYSFVYTAGSPPSTDTTSRYYLNATKNSAAYFIADCSHASRVFRTAGQTAFADTLAEAAYRAWAWSQKPANDTLSDAKLWAAAEIFRLDTTLTAARTYVNNYQPTQWQGWWMNPGEIVNYGVWAYCLTPAATPTVVNNMKNSMGQGIDALFGYNDNYLSGLIAGHYCWSSNQYKAEYGIMLRMGILLGVTGSHTVPECWDQALNYWHYLNGLNAMNMLYQTNMAALGGEHSVFQAYHSWFGYGMPLYDGKPAAVSEPFYPYYPADSQTSTYGTAPGHVVGGPNRFYSGNQTPPGNQVYYHRFYRDWHFEDTGQRKSWEVNETAIYYTGSYLCLGSFFMKPGGTACNEKTDGGNALPALAVDLDPAARRVRINFSLPRAGMVKLTIYDLKGSKVATLIQGEQGPGRHEAYWMPGDKVAAGVYFARLIAEGGARVGKFVLF